MKKLLNRKAIYLLPHFLLLAVAFFYFGINSFNLSFAQASLVPTVSITSPQNGAVITTVQTLSTYSGVLQVQTNLDSVCKYIIDNNFPNNFNNNNLITMTSAPNDQKYHARAFTVDNNESHTINIKCANANSLTNISNLYSVTFQVGQAPDNAPPTIEIISPANNSSLTALQTYTLTIKTNEPGVCRYGTNQGYGTNPGYALMSPSNSFTASPPDPNDNNKITWTASINNSNSAGTRTIYISCRDQALNQSNASVTYTFVTGGVSNSYVNIKTFTSSQTTVPANGNITLNWELEFNNLPVGQSISCTRQSNPSINDWSGSFLPGTNLIGSINLTGITQATTFTLNCSAGALSDQETVTISNSGGSGSGGGTGGTNQQTNLPTVSLQANPTNVPSIGSNITTTLTWSTTNTSNCTASSNPPVSSWSGPVSSLNNSTGVSVPVTSSSQTYKLSCNGTGANIGTLVESEVSIQVTPPNLPQITFSSNPQTINSVGGSSTLSWSITSSQPVTSCSTSTNWPAGSVPGPSNLSSSQVVSPTTTTTYSITCSNVQGSSTKSVTVFYNPVQGQQGPSILTFTANPTSINLGGSSNLNWQVNGADSCTLTGGGLNYTSGLSQNNRAVSPTNDTTYTLTCTNSTGQSDVATVSVSVDTNSNNSGSFLSGNQGGGLVGFTLVPNCSNPQDINDLVDPADPGRGTKIACDFDDLIELIKNFIDLMLLFITPIVLVMAVQAGFQYLTSGGNAGKASSAKEKFGQLAIGILIMLLGWLAVATFLRILGVPEAYSFLSL